MFLNIIIIVMRDVKDGTKVFTCIIVISCQNIFEGRGFAAV